MFQSETPEEREKRFSAIVEESLKEHDLLGRLLAEAERVEREQAEQSQSNKQI